MREFLLNGNNKTKNNTQACNKRNKRNSQNARLEAVFFCRLRTLCVAYFAYVVWVALNENQA